MFGRFVERRAQEALSDMPVVLIVGPRRAGKTTLVRKMSEAHRTYIRLDDQTVLAAAQSDPAGFIRGLDRTVIDEIQRAPDLLVAIKKTVEEDYRPGRFLRTGSANVRTLPRIADSLAGWTGPRPGKSKLPRKRWRNENGNLLALSHSRGDSNQPKPYTAF
nr:AAA family ATPase [Acidiferrobacter sp.]